LRVDGCLKWKRPKIGEGISMPLEDNGVLVPDFDFVAVKNGATAVVAE
jgi:predicted RecB family endonuclease